MKNKNLFLLLIPIILIGCSKNNKSESIPNEMIGLWKVDSGNDRLLISSNSVKHITESDTTTILLKTALVNDCIECEKAILNFENENISSSIKYYNFQSPKAAVILYTSEGVNTTYSKL